MSAAYAWRKDRRTWLVTVHWNRERERIKVDTEQTAKDLVRYVHKLELAGTNVIEALRQARTPAAAPTPAPPPPAFPALRDALPAWLERQARAGEIRASTERLYSGHLRRWCYAHSLPDGRTLGDEPVDAVTREMLGAVIRRIREAGRSLAVIEGVRTPLRGYYADLIETKVLAGPNPAADLKHFIGRGAHRKARARRAVYFAQEEGPALVATARAWCPRWAPFILTGLLGGLRWGESAALRRADIDWRRGAITVERTVSDKGHRIERCKDEDVRSVKTSPVLLAALRAHLEAMELEGQLQDWPPDARALVFPTAYGNVVRYPYFLTRVWRPLVAKAGLPYRKYHATRHTYATWLLTDGADLRWVQLQMGHASIGQTADTYGHVQPDRHEAAAAGLDRYLA